MAKGQFAKDAPPHETTPTTVYILNGIMCVPHYYKTDEYVMPGHRAYGVTYTAAELMRAGARQDTYQLWAR